MPHAAPPHLLLPCRFAADCWTRGLSIWFVQQKDALRCTGGDRQQPAATQQEAGSDAEAAARRGAGCLRQGHLSFAPVLRPEAAGAAAGGAVNGGPEPQERKRDANGNVKVTGEGSA